MANEWVAVDWKTSEKLGNLELFLGLMDIVALVLIYIIFPSQVTLVLLSGIYILIWYIMRISGTVPTATFGKNGKVALAMLFVGILLGMVFTVFSLQSTSLLFLASTTPTAVDYTTDWNLVWIGAFFAVNEELLWRDALAPAFYKFTHTKWFSIILANVLFATAHFAAAMATLGAKFGVVTPTLLLLSLFGDFAFGMLCSVGNGLGKTSTFGKGLHIANNLSRLLSGKTL